VVLNLLFSYDGKDFLAPVPALSFRGLRYVGREMITETSGKKIVENLSFLHVSGH